MLLSTKNFSARLQSPHQSAPYIVIVITVSLETKNRQGRVPKHLIPISIYELERLPYKEKVKIFCAGVWVGAQVDPLVVFVDVVSELGWG